MALCNETGIYRYKTFQSEKNLLRSNIAVKTNNVLRSSRFNIKRNVLKILKYTYRVLLYIV